MKLPHITSPDAALDLNAHLTRAGWQSALLAHLFIGCDNTLREVVEVYATRGDLRLAVEWSRPTSTGEWVVRWMTATLRGSGHALSDFRCAHPLDHRDAAVLCLTGLDQLRELAGREEEQAAGFVRAAAKKAVFPGGVR